MTTSGAFTNLGSLEISSLSTGARSLVTIGGNLLNAGNISLEAGSGGGSWLTVNGVLTNKGSFNAGAANTGRSTTVVTNGLVNTGGIGMASSPTSAFVTQMIVKAAAGFGTAGVLTGTVSLSGYAGIDFSSGQIASIAGGASLTLNGPNALIADAGALTSNSALAGLNVVSGTPTLGDGASFSTTGALANSGAIGLDNYGNGYSTSAAPAGGSSLKIGGVLTNNLVIESGSSYSSGAQSPTTIAATGGIVNNSSVYNYGGDQIIRIAVTGTGWFYINGYGSTLTMTEFDSSVGSGQNVYFQSSGEIVFGAGAAKGFAATINGWSLNDLIDVKVFGTGTTESFSGNVLTLTNGTNVAHLAFSGATAAQVSLTNTGTDSILKFV